MSNLYSSIEQFEKDIRSLYTLARHAIESKDSFMFRAAINFLKKIEDHLFDQYFINIDTERLPKEVIKVLKSFYEECDSK